MGREADHAGGVLHLLKGTWSDFGRDECGTRAAALAYSTVFALPPLLILLVTVVGLVWDPADVQHALETQLTGVVGPAGAQQIHDMIAHGRQSPGSGLLATVGSIVGLILGATGAFLALQQALNRAWNVKPDPRRGGVRVFLTKRLLSAGMVLGLGFILAVSLALTAAVSAIGGAVGGVLPTTVLVAANAVVSFIVLAALFGAIFKVLPDAEVAWRDVQVGSVATALLFVAGKFVIGLYLGHSKPGDAFGAASALAVVLVWAYYSGVIILLGAEFTQQWARQHGHPILPEPGAVQVKAADDNIVPSASVSGAPNAAVGADHSAGARSAVKRGGLGAWILGLPVLYLLFRRRPRDR